MNKQAKTHQSDTHWFNSWVENYCDQLDAIKDKLEKNKSDGELLKELSQNSFIVASILLDCVRTALENNYPLPNRLKSFILEPIYKLDEFHRGDSNKCPSFDDYYHLKLKVHTKPKLINFIDFNVHILGVYLSGYIFGLECFPGGTTVNYHQYNPIVKAKLKNDNKLSKREHSYVNINFKNSHLNIYLHGYADGTWGALSKRGTKLSYQYFVDVLYSSSMLFSNRMWSNKKLIQLAINSIMLNVLVKCGTIVLDTECDETNRNNANLIGTLTTKYMIIGEATQAALQYKDERLIALWNNPDNVDAFIDEVSKFPIPNMGDTCDVYEYPLPDKSTKKWNGLGSIPNEFKELISEPHRQASDYMIDY